MITIVGTGHIFNISPNLKNLFTKIQPDVICVELDKNRYNALKNRYQDSKSHSEKRRNLPLFYTLFLRFQQRSARKFGVNPGDEMLTAINYAQKNNLPFKFIDGDFQIIYQKIMESLTLKEKLKLAFVALFLTFFGWYLTRRKKVEKDLEKFDKNFDKNLQKMQASYPIIKKFLLDDRNKHMAKKIMKLKEKHRNIVACVGDGHVVGISRILKENNVDFKAIRLKSLLYT